MTDLEHTVQSKKTLLKASAFASLLATLIFIIAILPAEFGIDPTGLGKAMGLTQLANQTLPPQVPTTKQTLPKQDNNVDIPIPAGERTGI